MTKYRKLKKRYFACDSTDKEGAGDKIISLFVDTETVPMVLEQKADGEEVWNRWKVVRINYKWWFCGERTGLPLNEDEFVAGEFFNAEDFIKYVTDLARIYQEIPIKMFAHNWDFDAGVLRIASELFRKKYRYSIPFDDGIHYDPEGGGMAPFLMLIRAHFEPVYRGNDEYYFYNTINLIDTTNFYKRPLKEVMADMGMVKPDLPDATYEEYLADPEGVAELYRERCEEDVEGLAAAWFSLCKFGDEMFGVKPRTTIARMALAAFARSKEYKWAITETTDDDEALYAGITEGANNVIYPKCEEDFAIETSLIEGYKGGRTESFYKGVPKEYEKLYSYDVVSMFPAAMRGKIACRLISTFSQPDTVIYGLAQTLENPDRIAYIKCDLYVPHSDVYGAEGIKRADRGLIFPTGSLNNMWVWEEAFRYYQKRGYVKRVKEVHSYVGISLFTRYVEMLGDMKREFGEQGNGTYRALTKLLMNSLYGIMGKKARGKWVKVYRADEQDMLKNSGEHDFISGVHYYKGLDNEWYFYDKDYLVFDRLAVPSIASHITSKARLVLLRKMNDLRERGINVFYVDTDSIKIDERIDGDSDVGKALGQWEFEGESQGTFCNFYAPKDYVFNNKATRKGDKEPDPDSRESKNDVFSGFSKSLRRKSEDRFEMLEDGGCVLRNRNKVFNGRNKKRIEPPGGRGWTQPLRLNRGGKVGSKWRNDGII